MGGFFAKIFLIVSAEKTDDVVEKQMVFVYNQYMMKIGYSAVLQMISEPPYRTGEKHGNPHSAVLFLRCMASTPEMMKIRIATPEGSIFYNIHVMKIQVYSIEEIFEKELLFLIPFHIFSYESRFYEYNADKEKLTYHSEI